MPWTEADEAYFVNEKAAMKAVIDRVAATEWKDRTPQDIAALRDVQKRRRALDAWTRKKIRALQYRQIWLTVKIAVIGAAAKVLGFVLWIVGLK